MVHVLGDFTAQKRRHGIQYDEHHHWGAVEAQAPSDQGQKYLCVCKSTYVPLCFHSFLKFSFVSW